MYSVACTNQSIVHKITKNISNKYTTLPNPSSDVENFNVEPFNQTQTIILIVTTIIIVLLLGLLVYFLLSRPSKRAFVETIAIAADREREASKKLIGKYKKRLRTAIDRGGTDINLRITGPSRHKYVVGYSKTPKKNHSLPVVDYTTSFP